MLKSVPRSATDNPNILVHRMSINQKIAIRRVLILADARLHHRRIRQPWHSFSEILTHRLQSARANNSLAKIRIELLPVRVDRDLETATIKVRQRINEIVEIDPRRHDPAIKTVVAGRDTKKDYLLSRHMDQLTEQVGKQL